MNKITKVFNFNMTQCRYCNAVVGIVGHDCSAKYAAKNKIVWHGKVRHYGKFRKKKK